MTDNSDQRRVDRMAKIIKRQLSTLPKRSGFGKRFFRLNTLTALISNPYR